MFIMNCGIYKITNVVDGKNYVGSSIELSRRKNTHFNLLRNNKHPNRYLQNAYNKYGEDNFKFTPIEFVEEKELELCEAKHIKELNSMYYSNGYNLKDVDENGRPMHSKESRELISKSLKGRKHTKEFSERMSKLHKGVPKSEEHKKKISESKKGCTSPFKDKSHSEDAKIAMSNNRKGKATTSLEKLIELYGQEEGLAKYNEYKSKIGKKGRSHHNAKRCIIDDVIYECAKEASTILDIKYPTLIYKLGDKRHKNFNWE